MTFQFLYLKPLTIPVSQEVRISKFVLLWKKPILLKSNSTRSILRKLNS